MRVIVTGSKNMDDYETIRKKLDILLIGLTNVVILTGGEMGVELLAEKYCVEMGHDIVCLPIDWEEYGKKAAIIRNEYMYKNADHCIIFWDGKSQDTGYSVGAAKKYGVEYRVIRY
jgi:uncharacterized phage-like protein YoqJ